MFHGNNEYEPSEQALMLATDLNGAEMHTNNEVRVVVEQEFSLMDQEHARIRADALAASLRKSNMP